MDFVGTSVVADAAFDDGDSALWIIIQGDEQ